MTREEMVAVVTERMAVRQSRSPTRTSSASALGSSTGGTTMTKGASVQDALPRRPLRSVSANGHRA